MNFRRSQQMIIMAQMGQTANSLDLQMAQQYHAMLIPSFESTKGTTVFERELAIRGKILSINNSCLKV